jgi:hypothetical protein
MVGRTLVANRRLAGSACGKRRIVRPLNWVVRLHVKSHHRVWIRVAGFLSLAFPMSAWANAGVPMLMLAWPAYILGLIPIVFLEAFIGTKDLHLSWAEALSVTAVGNLWSTFLGIPLTWVAMFAIEAIVGVTLGTFHVSENVQMLLFPFLVAWVPGFENIWLFYAAFVILSIPFCIASIWIERKVALRKLPSRPPQAIRDWIKHANIWSYGIIIAVTAIFPAMK